MALSACFHKWNGFCFKVGVDMKIANLSELTGSSGLEAGLARVLDNICQHSSNSSLQTGHRSCFTKDPQEVGRVVTSTF